MEPTPHNSTWRLFAPPPPAPPLPPDDVERLYPWYRWRALEATFIGYAMYYLVRNNLSVVALDVQDSLGYSKAMIGRILAITALSYGLSKFLMGSVSDRSDPRKFMAAGLLLSAICNFAFGASTQLQLCTWRCGPSTALCREWAGRRADA